MNARKAKDPGIGPEVTTPLSKVAPGGCFRFPERGSFDEAISADDGNCFYMVVTVTPVKANHVTLVSLDNGQLFEYDSERHGVEHHVDLGIKEAKRV